MKKRKLKIFDFPFVQYGLQGIMLHNKSNGSRSAVMMAELHSGVSVGWLRAPSNGVTSDFVGFTVISVPETIRRSSIFLLVMETKEVLFGNQSTLRVTLATSSETIGRSGRKRHLFSRERNP